MRLQIRENEDNTNQSKVLSLENLPVCSTLYIMSVCVCLCDA